MGSRPNLFVVGDASPSYLWDPEAAGLIQNYNPEARIVILLRDPVQRAISQYWMEVGLGVQGERNLLRAFQQDEHVRPRRYGTASHMYVDLGRYTEQVARYLDAFGRGRVLILESVDLRAARDETLTRVAVHLGIDPSGFDSGVVATEVNSIAISQVSDRIAHLRGIKRAGHVLDEQQRSRQVVPLAVW